MNNDLLTYLQQDNIGKVIAKGLADVYTHKPQAPVKYLAAWLKKYSGNQQEIAKLEHDLHNKSVKDKELQHQILVDHHTAEYKKTKSTEQAAKLQAFKLRVQNDEYQEELLFKEFPEFVEKKIGLTGAYIGHINHPPRQITEQDQEENAHLDTSIPKLINYIGSSNSHAELMLGKTLPLDKGVTAAALALSLEEPVAAEDGTVEAKEKYVYIPNVVKNENMHYFRLPKLGSYISVPLIYNSYLTEHIFDVALESRLKYLGEVQEFEKAQVEELKEIEAEVHSVGQKLTEATEKNDEAGIEAAKTELAQLTKRKNEREDEELDQQHIELPAQKRQFLVCGDTLGKDVQISAENRTLLVELVKHFRDSWQKKEKQLLYKDVDYQIKISKTQQKTPQAYIQNLQKKIQISPQNLAVYNQIQDEKLRQYRKSAWQLQTLKTEVREDQKYLASFFKLKNFRVAKFKTLIHNLLHFLGLKKSEINLPGKTQLDWKKVRATHLFAETFAALLNYNPQGPKAESYPFYCKISHINEILQKSDEHEVFKYNIGLGALLTLVKKQIALRIANIEMRRSQKEKQREQRNHLIEENDKITEEKLAALQKHKQSLSGEDVQAFKEEEWVAKYDEENPLKQIPPEVVDDIDNDF